MKAIIMAGGEGTRLRPLTCDCPKPMLRIMGKPILEYALKLLKRSGIKEAGVTLGYLPNAIRDYFEDGREFGVHLCYYIEKTPLGTAGSVRLAKDFLDERFLVLSGDGVCDLDVEAAVRFHLSRGAKATMILCRHPEPTEYGMVVLNPDQTVRSFHEKPAKGEAFSNLINTGIYILEPDLIDRIPENEASDFGHDFFPALLRDGIEVHGFVSEGYWCDVGDVGAYLAVHSDALRGKISLIAPDDGAVALGAVIEPTAQIEAPCYIAEGAHICGGAYIGADSWIGKGAVIESGASIKRSVILSNARIGENAQLRGSVVGQNAVIEEEAQLFEESVVGSHSKVGKRATLMQGVKLWPRKAVAAGEQVEGNVVWGAGHTFRFASDKLLASEPAQAARVAQGLISELKSGDILLGRTASGVADAMFHAVLSGMMAQGIRVSDAGICSLPQLRRLQQNIRASAAALVDEKGVYPIDLHGAPLSERKQRAILKAVERQDYATAFSGITKPPVLLGDSRWSYAGETSKLFGANALYAPKILLTCENMHVLELATLTFERVGLRVRSMYNTHTAMPDADEICILLSDRGEHAYLFEKGQSMDEALREMMCAWTLLQLGQTQLLLKINATRGVEQLCTQSGAVAAFVSGEPAAWYASMAEKAPLQFLIHTDGIAAALAFLSILTDRGESLAQWRSNIPKAYRSYQRVSLPQKQSVAALQRLYEHSKDAQTGGGIRLNTEDGWAWLTQDEERAEMCVMAESTRYETAQEICAFYAKALKEMIATQND